MAIIPDLYDAAFNFLGQDGTVTTTDGQTLCNAVTSNLANNSLESQAVGVDKKDFGTFHFYKYSAGGIMKTSTDPITNSRMKMSSCRLDPTTGTWVSGGPLWGLNKKMLDTIKWSSVLEKYREEANFSQHIVEPDGKIIFNWNLSYSGQPIYGGIKSQPNVYIKQYRPIVKGKEIVSIQSYYIKRTNFKWKNGITYYDEVEVDNKGNNVGKVSHKETIKPIDSAFDLWNLFGGELSAHLENGVLTDVNDETSFDLVTEITNLAGIKVTGVDTVLT